MAYVHADLDVQDRASVFDQLKDVAGFSRLSIYSAVSGNCLPMQNRMIGCSMSFVIESILRYEHVQT
jgi:hypothetical protein